jgi:hypothetical protein
MIDLAPSFWGMVFHNGWHDLGPSDCGLEVECLSCYRCRGQGSSFYNILWHQLTNLSERNNQLRTRSPEVN